MSVFAECLNKALRLGVALLLIEPVFFSEAKAQSVTNTVTITNPENVSCQKPDSQNQCHWSASDTDTVVTPQLNIKKSHSDVFAADKQSDYQLTVSNTGKADTSGAVTIVDQLPQGMSFVAFQGAGWTCDASNQQVTCHSAETIAAGQTGATLTITVAVSETASGTLTNQANVSGGGDSTCSSNSSSHDPDRCRASDQTEIQPASRSTLSKSVDPTGDILPGSELNYQLELSISGSPSTEDVTLSDSIDSRLIFESVTDAGSYRCSEANNRLTCTLPTNQKPGKYQLGYRVKVKDDATGTIENSVSATTKSGKHLPQCQSCQTQSHIKPTEIVVRKTVDQTSQVKPGQTLTYTLTAEIQNSSTTQTLTLNDHFGPGLRFDKVIDAGQYTCHESLVCELAAGTKPGTYPVKYTAIVADDATGNIKNQVTATNPQGGDPDPQCESCAATSSVIASKIAVKKTVSPEGETLPGAVLTYTLTATVSESATTQVLTLQDTFSRGLTFSQVTDAGEFTCHDALTCELPAGKKPGSYAVKYTAVVNDDATGQLSNHVTASNPSGGDEDPSCDPCTTQNQVKQTGVSVSKSVNPAGEVSPGETLRYSLKVVVSTSATTQDVQLSDTLGQGLQFEQVVNSGKFSCHDTLECTLSAGAVPGTYTVEYTAKVKDDATGSVRNTLTAQRGNREGTEQDPDPVCSTCTTENKVKPYVVKVHKSANPPSGEMVNPNQTIHYVLTADVKNSYTTESIQLTDTLDGPIVYLAPVPSGCTQEQQRIVCELPAQSRPGTYTWEYQAQVSPTATGSVRNSVTAQSSHQNQVSCDACTTEHPIVPAEIKISHQSDPADGTPVHAGQQIHHSISNVITNSPTTGPVTVRQTFGQGMKLVGSPPQGCQAVDDGLECTIPAGTTPGSRHWDYVTEVVKDAAGPIDSHVVVSGKDKTSCSQCQSRYPLLNPALSVNKSVNPKSGQSVVPGQDVAYDITANISQTNTVRDITLVETISPNQTIIGSIPAGCRQQEQQLICTIAAGTPPGNYLFQYHTNVKADAVDQINTNLQVNGADQTQCQQCQTAHPVVNQWQLRLRKSVSTRQVRVGDLVQYTIDLENISDSEFHGDISDALPDGFAILQESLISKDMDGIAQVVGMNMLQLHGVDVRPHGKASFTYFARVGANIISGTHPSTAMATTKSKIQVSNKSTVTVVSVNDPLMQTSLVFGTVFDDRDGDGWQDRADAQHVQVQGGIDSRVYIPNSTQLIQDGHIQAIADASMPLAHGITIDHLPGRQSESDKSERNVIIIRQRVTHPQFTDDFHLQTREGAIVQISASGQIKITKKGQLARGLVNTELTVERQVSADGDAFAVSYIIRNLGIDERGIPGVRIVAIEGLMIETDQFGRYHIEDTLSGNDSRGRNFILKVDQATLAHGAMITTANPLIRRITPGLPVRFDFGVRNPQEKWDNHEQSKLDSVSDCQKKIQNKPHNLRFNECHNEQIDYRDKVRGVSRKLPRNRLVNENKMLSNETATIDRFRQQQWHDSVEEETMSRLKRH